LDFQGNIADPKVQSALDQLTRSTRFVRILGCFPSDDQPPTVAAITPPAPSETRAGEGDGVTEDHPTPPVQPRRSGYRLASRAHKPADTVIEVRGVKIGGDRFVVIAGPCAVESEAQISTCAQAVREHGSASTPTSSRSARAICRTSPCCARSATAFDRSCSSAA